MPCWPSSQGKQDGPHWAAISVRTVWLQARKSALANLSMMQFSGCSGFRARTRNTPCLSKGERNEFQLIHSLCSSAQNTDSWWGVCDWPILSQESDAWLKEVPWDHRTWGRDNSTKKKLAAIQKVDQKTNNNYIHSRQTYNTTISEIGGRKWFYNSEKNDQEN